MKVIFFGDIVGKAGRKAIKKVLPELIKDIKPDFVIGNIENLAHGKGITEKTVAEMKNAGIDAFTSGNHIFQRKEGIELLKIHDTNILRPANYPPDAPGIGFKLFPIRTKNILLINIIGRVFFREDYDCPFRVVDEIIKNNQAEADVILVDFHKEATSESKAMAHYLNGRVSALLGTHTHIPTADAQVLKKGTAYITDVGMVGIKDSVLGVENNSVLEHFLTQMPFEYDIVEEGMAEVNYVIMEFGSNGKAKNIEKCCREIEV